MTNYNAPLTFEQKVDTILEGLFVNEYMRADIKESIIDEVRERIEKNKMTTDISSVQTAVCWTIYYRLIK
jgi:hypothetical protein